ncbi:MAG: hypothetical protein AB7D47_04365 [Desulfovibrio sp.]|jgi:hypothetical protein
MERMRIDRLRLCPDPYRPSRVRWKDPDAGTLYRRVSGGLAWPHDVRPGAVVVLAEQQEVLPGQDVHAVEVLAEFQNPDIGLLLAKAMEWRDRLGCRGWLTPLDAPELQLVNDYNEERRRFRLPLLECTAPPSVNGKSEFAAYHRLLERRTRGRKSLFFGEGSQVAREYKVRQKADTAKRLELFPVLAAFLWALADIELNDASGRWTSRQGGSADKLGGY